MPKPKAGESLQHRKARAGRILAALRKRYGPVTCALHHNNALELLVATILSAQSTDETVNRITPTLFKKYPDAASYADAPGRELEAAIRRSGFFRQKAKAIRGACRMIVEKFDGEVPATMEALLQLPGVARKTANVVLGTWFKKKEGLVVDTHVGRLAERLALTWRAKNAKDAGRIEQDLMEVIPRRSWTYFSHAMIWHGRKVCKSRNPDCDECPVAGDCPSAGAFDQACRRRFRVPADK